MDRDLLALCKGFAPSIAFAKKRIAMTNLRPLSKMKMRNYSASGAGSKISEYISTHSLSLTSLPWDENLKPDL